MEGLEFKRLERKTLAKAIAVALVLLGIALVFLLPAALPQGRQVSARVFDASSGAPLEGASVLLLQDGNVIGFKRTKPSGTAVFSNSPRGAVSLKVEAEGYASQELKAAEKNEVGLEPQLLPARTQAIKPPEQPTQAFELDGKNKTVPEFEDDRSSPTLSKLTREGRKLFEQELQAAPRTTPPDCTQIITATASSTPTPSATIASPTTASTSASPPPTQGPVPSSPPLPPGAETEFSIKFRESFLLEGNTLTFTDYSPGGAVMLSVTPRTGASFRVIFNSQTNSTEIAGIKLEFVRLDNETPPTAFFKASRAAGSGASAVATATAGAGGATASPTPQAASGTSGSTGGASAGGDGTAGSGGRAAASIVVSIDYPWENTVLSSKQLAWGKAGAANGVYAVEVSTDGGRNWKRAEGGSNWAAQIDFTAAGSIDLRARAIDCRGRVQEAVPVRLWGSSCKAIVQHGSHEKKFDLAIIPSKYDGDFEKFSADAQASLEYAFSTPPLNTLQFFGSFNIFFYNGEAECSLAGDKPPENRAWKCEVPRPFHESCTFADLSVVFVNSGLRAGKSGNPIVASAGEKQILLHELGHSLFGLADEYCCDGGYWRAKPVPNIYSTKQDCEAATGKECEMIGGGVEWFHPRIERGLMQALERNFFDETDTPAAQAFLKKYGG